MKIRRVIKEFVDKNYNLPWGFPITPDELDYMRKKGYVRFEDMIKEGADWQDEKIRELLSEGNPEAYAGHVGSESDIKE